MKIYQHPDLAENGVVTLLNLISTMNIPVTRTTVNEVRSHSEYPSMVSLSDLLTEWNVENLGVEISLEQLSQIPLPAICHLNVEGTKFVVLHKCTEKEVTYIDSQIGWVTEHIIEFDKKWTKAALLAQRTEDSGENDYAKKRRKEIIKQFKSIGLISICVILVTLSAFLIPAAILFSWLSLVALKCAGITLCFGLFLKQIGLSNNFLKKVCNASKGFDCNSALKSSASTLFGFVSMAELGMIYFLGGLISLLLITVFEMPFFNVLFILNILTLPYAFFSVFFQWRNLKVWCPLCLGVILCFLVEFALLFQIASLKMVKLELVLNLFGFGIIIIGWLLFRDMFISARHAGVTKRAFLNFKYNPSIFMALFDKQPQVEIDTLKHEIILGTESAPTSITLVSNPTCGPCSLAHLELERLLQNYKNRLKVNVRFLVNPSHDESDSYLVAREIFRKATTGNREDIREALHSWFSGSDKDIKEWKRKINDHETVPDEKLVDELFKKHSDWCMRAKVKVTPTFFINNRKLPDEYDFRDLKYHLRHLMRS